MTVATARSISPVESRCVVRSSSPTSLPVTGDDCDGVESHSNISDQHSATIATRGNACFPHPVTEHQSRHLVDLLLEEDERRACLDIVEAATTSTRNETDGTTVTFLNSSQQAGSIVPNPREGFGANQRHPYDQAVCGWERSSVLSVKKPETNPRVGARKKAGLKSSVSSTSFDLASEGVSAPATHGGIVRVVSEDYVPGAHSHTHAAWKSNVEPGTYRYIVNNGIYRSTKFASLGGDWVTAKRSKGGPGSTVDSQSNSSSHHHRSSTAVTAAIRASDVRHAQTIIRRDLNRYRFGSNQADKTLHFEHSNVGESAVSQKNCGSREPSRGKGFSSRLDSNCVNEINATNKHNNNIHQSHQQTVPPWSSSSSSYSRPDTRDPELVKTTSDLFVEKFSSKIDALEKEDPTTCGTPEGLPRPGTNLAVAVNSLQSNTAASASRRVGQKQVQTTEGHGAMTLNVSGRSSSTLVSDDISKDIFTVKPAVGIRVADQLPLKPLEKLTPQMQKRAQRGMKQCNEREKGESNGGAASDKMSEASYKPAADNGDVYNTNNNDSRQSKTSAVPSGIESPTNLSTSFMTAMNAFSQGYSHYHLMDISVGQQSHHGHHYHSKSSPPTFRAHHNSGYDSAVLKNGYNYRNKTYDNRSNHGSKSHHNKSMPYQHTNTSTPSDTDSLSSVKNALSLTNNDIEKMRMNQLAIRDYNRNVCARATKSTLSTKPPAGKRRTSGSDQPPGPAANIAANQRTLGLRPFNNSSAPPPQPLPRHHRNTVGEDISSGHSDSESEAFLAGTSLLVGRGVRERGMSLPEIAGKRLPVTTSNQRML